MAIAFVQSAKATGGTVTFTNPTTAGNTIIVAFRPASGAVPNNVITDTQGNFYRQAFFATSRVVIYHSIGIIGGSTTALTIVTGGSALAGSAIAVEYSGITGVNTLPGAAASAVSTSFTSGPITPTATNNLVVVGFDNETTTPILSALTGGFVERSPSASNFHYLDLIQSSATSATAAGTINTSVNWTTGLVVYSGDVGAGLPCFCQSNGVATTTAAFLRSTQPGNLLIASVRFAPSSGTPTASDTVGNTWTLVNSRVVGTAREAMFMALNCLGGTPTVSFPTGGTVIQVALAEYNGVNTLFGTTVTNGQTPGTAFSLGPITPPVPVSIFVSTMANETVNNMTFSALSAQLIVRAQGTGNATILDTRLIASAATTVSATLSQSMNWGGVGAVFYFNASNQNLLMMMGAGT